MESTKIFELTIDEYDIQSFMQAFRNNIGVFDEVNIDIIKPTEKQQGEFEFLI